MTITRNDPNSVEAGLAIEAMAAIMELPIEKIKPDGNPEFLKKIKSLASSNIPLRDALETYVKYKDNNKTPFDIKIFEQLYEQNLSDKQRVIVCLILNEFSEKKRVTLTGQFVEKNYLLQASSMLINMKRFLSFGKTQSELLGIKIVNIAATNLLNTVIFDDQIEQLIYENIENSNPDPKFNLSQFLKRKILNLFLVKYFPDDQARRQELDAAMQESSSDSQLVCFKNWVIDSGSSNILGAPNALIKAKVLLKLINLLPYEYAEIDIANPFMTLRNDLNKRVGSWSFQGSEHLVEMFFEGHLERFALSSNFSITNDQKALVYANLSAYLIAVNGRHFVRGDSTANAIFAKIYYLMAKMLKPDMQINPELQSIYDQITLPDIFFKNDFTYDSLGSTNMEPALISILIIHEELKKSDKFIEKVWQKQIEIFLQKVNRGLNFDSKRFDECRENITPLFKAFQKALEINDDILSIPIEKVKQALIIFKFNNPKLYKDLLMHHVLNFPVTSTDALYELSESLHSGKHGFAKSDEFSTACKALAANPHSIQTYMAVMSLVITKTKLPFEDAVMAIDRLDALSSTLNDNEKIHLIALKTNCFLKYRKVFSSENLPTKLKVYFADIIHSGKENIRLKEKVIKKDFEYLELEKDRAESRLDPVLLSTDMQNRFRLVSNLNTISQRISDDDEKDLEIKQAATEFRKDIIVDGGVEAAQPSLSITKNETQASVMFTRIVEDSSELHFSGSASDLEEVDLSSRQEEVSPGRSNKAASIVAYLSAAALIAAGIIFTAGLVAAAAGIALFVGIPMIVVGSLIAIAGYLFGRKKQEEVSVFPFADKVDADVFNPETLLKDKAVSQAELKNDDVAIKQDNKSSGVARAGLFAISPVASPIDQERKYDDPDGSPSPK